MRVGGVVMMTSYRRDNSTSQHILNFLESIKGNCREIVIKGVAVGGSSFEDTRELARIIAEFISRDERT